MFAKPINLILIALSLVCGQISSSTSSPSLTEIFSLKQHLSGLKALLFKIQLFLRKDLDKLYKEKANKTYTESDYKDEYKVDKYGDSIVGAVLSVDTDSDGLTKVSKGNSKVTSVKHLDPGADINKKIAWREAMLKSLTDLITQIDKEASVHGLLLILSSTASLGNDIISCYNIDFEEVKAILDQYGGAGIKPVISNFIYWKSHILSTLGIFTFGSMGGLIGFCTTGNCKSVLASMIGTVAIAIAINLIILFWGYSDKWTYAHNQNKFNEIQGLFNIIKKTVKEAESLMGTFTILDKVQKA